MNLHPFHALRRSLFLVALLAPFVARAQIGWTAPVSVPSGQPYFVGASGSYTSITLYKNGWYFASGANFAGASTSDTGPNTISYRADGSNPGTWTDYRSVTITAPNRAPSADISGDTSLTLSGGTASGSWSFSASDPDGNLYRWRVSLAPNVARWSYISGSSQSASMGYTFTAAGTYTFNLDVEDTNGASASDSVTVTVLAAPTYYSLNVVSGSGDGSYLANAWAHIVANSAQSGYEFVGWSKNYGPGTIAETWMPDAYFLMGAGNAEVEATYQQITEYLSVVNGTGSGYYPGGTWVNISANSPPSGKVFSGWVRTSGSGSFENASLPNTRFYTSLFSTTIEATYADVLYRLTVDSGTGDGDYPAGRVVQIRADNAPSGKTFSHWSVSGPGSVASSGSMLTSFTMGSGPATVTAVYDTIYTLTVINGRVNGATTGYYLAGTAVTLVADAPSAGYEFSQWTLSGPGTIVPPGGASTGFTTGAGNATVTAQYSDKEAPTVPAGLAAGSVTPTSFTLSWSPSTDNAGVAAYQVRRDGVSLGEVGETSKSVTGLTAGATYQMTVRARDAASNWSGWSSPLPVTTSLNLPVPPAASAATGITNNGFTANWSVSSGATTYRLDVSISSSFSSYVPGYQDLDVGNVTSRSVTGLTGGTTYYYRVRAANSGGPSSNSNTITVTTTSGGPAADPDNQNELNIHLPLSP